MSASSWLRAAAPPTDLLKRFRLALVLFVPLSLLPWLISLGRAAPTQLGFGLLALGLAAFTWARIYRSNTTPSVVLDVLHLPIALGVLLASPHAEGRGAPGEASLFTISMLLQAFGGSWVRMFVRLLALGGATLIAATLTQHAASYILFGLASANLFSYLLGRALETERRALGRANQLTAAAAQLSEAHSREELETLTAQLVTNFAPSRAVRVRLTKGVTTPVPQRATGGIDLSVIDARGVAGRLNVELTQKADRDLEPSLSTLLSIAVQNAARLELQHTEHEMQLAAGLQASLLPKRFSVRGFEIAASMLPATEVGGDYFDVLETPTGCFVGIGDVSGHGLPAGLVMLMTQSVVSSLVRRDPHASPREIVCLLNEVLYENVQRRLSRTEHVTFSLLRFDVDGEVLHAGAHEDVLVWRAKTGLVERIATRGTWLGACPDVARATVESRFRLEVGDVVLLHTDGLTEARNSNREQFGLERLETTLGSACREGHPEKAIAQILEQLNQFTRRRDDDCTVLVMKYLGPAASTTAQPPVAQGRALA